MSLMRWWTELERRSDVEPIDRYDLVNVVNKVNLDSPITPVMNESESCEIS